MAIVKSVTVMVSARKFTFMHSSVSRYCCKCELMIFKWDCAFSFAHSPIHSFIQSWKPIAKSAMAAAAAGAVWRMRKRRETKILIAKKANKQTVRQWAVTFGLSLFFTYIHPIRLFIYYYYHLLAHQKHTHNAQAPCTDDSLIFLVFITIFRHFSFQNWIIIANRYSPRKHFPVSMHFK